MIQQKRTAVNTFQIKRERIFMYISVFSDELKREVTDVLPIFASWGMTHVDFRALINGMPIEKQSEAELHALKKQLDDLGLKTGVIQSSLCKCHLPSKERAEEEMKNLEGIIRASEILDCNLVRSFNFWQHAQDDPKCGELAMRPDMLSQVLEMFYPFAKRAREAGLILGFENCGQTPDEAIAVLDMLNVPEWGLAWDVSNMFEILPEAKGDCTAYFKKALLRANMLHVKARGVLSEVDGKKVPWERVLRGAATLGRDMPVSIETHVPAGNVLDGEQATKKCLDYLRKVWPASAPGDLDTALRAVQKFDRPYEDNPVNTVVIGLGMGKNRCLQIMDTNGMKLCGVCDTNAEKAKSVGEQFGVPYSDDLDVFLRDSNVEMCYVVVPTGDHANVARKCLEAGKNVLVTKPMDINAERCRDLIAFAKEKGLLLGCDFDLHFRGALTQLKNAVSDGYFGTLKEANIILNVNRTPEYYKENGGWRGTFALDGGGALSNQGIHEIDRLISCFGLPVSVRCVTKRQTFDIEAEDFGVSLWEYESGFVARISSTTSYPVPTWYTRIEVYGSRGAYLSTAGGPEGSHTYWNAEDGWTEDSPYPFTREWNQAADNFANALRTGEKLIVSAEEGAISRYVLDRMYESAKNGGEPVRINKEAVL